MKERGGGWRGCKREGLVEGEGVKEGVVEEKGVRERGWWRERV